MAVQGLKYLKKNGAFGGKQSEKSTCDAVSIKSNNLQRANNAPRFAWLSSTLYLKRKQRLGQSGCENSCGDSVTTESSTRSKHCTLAIDAILDDRSEKVFDEASSSSSCIYDSDDEYIFAPIPRRQAISSPPLMIFDGIPDLKRQGSKRKILSWKKSSLSKSHSSPHALQIRAPYQSKEAEKCLSPSLRHNRNGDAILGHGSAWERTQSSRNENRRSASRRNSVSEQLKKHSKAKTEAQLRSSPLEILTQASSQSSVLLHPAISPAYRFTPIDFSAIDASDDLSINSDNYDICKEDVDEDASLQMSAADDAHPPVASESDHTLRDLSASISNTVVQSTVTPMESKNDNGSFKSDHADIARSESNGTSEATEESEHEEESKLSLSTISDNKSVHNVHVCEQVLVKNTSSVLDDNTTSKFSSEVSTKLVDVNEITSFSEKGTASISQDTALETYFSHLHSFRQENETLKIDRSSEDVVWWWPLSQLSSICSIDCGSG